MHFVAITTVILLAVALIACFIPACHSANLDPMKALKSE